MIFFFCFFFSIGWFKPIFSKEDFSILSVFFFLLHTPSPSRRGEWILFVSNVLMDKMVTLPLSRGAGVCKLISYRKDIKESQLSSKNERDSFHLDEVLIRISRYASFD